MPRPLHPSPSIRSSSSLVFFVSLTFALIAAYLSYTASSLSSSSPPLSQATSTSPLSSLTSYFSPLSQSLPLSLSLSSLTSYFTPLSSTQSQSTSQSTSLTLTPSTTKYRIVIDAGSTGSRAFIYSISSNGSINKIGTSKTTPGLSTFLDSARNSDHTNDHDHDSVGVVKSSKKFMKLFNYAASVIPVSCHADTKLSIIATAGMRLLTVDEQDVIYDDLHSGLTANADFKFTLLRSDILTLSGNLEGFYSVLTTNYLLNKIHTNLTFTPNVTSPLGALDMGGSSTQIVFNPLEVDDDLRITGEDEFFIHSYLGYGGDVMRSRVWDMWVEEQDKSDSKNNNDVIDNPCAFTNWPATHKGRTLVGTGNSEQCSSEILRLLHKDGLRPSTKDAKYMKIDGIKQPPVRGKFYGMSLYFFALDCVRELSRLDGNVGGRGLVSSWPNPSMDELSAALVSFCARDWTNLEPIHSTIHDFTRSSGFPHRCIEGVYIVTLLRDGYGFDREGRDITFAFDVEGQEVEWTMGMVLVEAGEEGELV